MAEPSEQGQAVPFPVRAAPGAPLRRPSLLAAGLFLLGAEGLFAWLTGVEALKTLVSGGAAMSVWTAAAFTVLGGALLLGPSRRAGHVKAAAAGAVLLLSAAALAGHAARASSDALGTAYGSMSLYTGIGLACSCSALLLGAIGRGRWVADALAIGCVFLGAIGAVGYLYRVEAIRQAWGFQTMAVHTAAGLAVLGLGALFARADSPTGSILTQRNSVGASARRGLPVLVLAVVAIGWLRLEGEALGYYPTEFGLAIMVGSNSLLVAGLLLWNAHHLGRAFEDKERTLADERFKLALATMLRRSDTSADVARDVAVELGRYLDCARVCFFEVDRENRVIRALPGHDRSATALPAVMPLASFSPTTFGDLEAGRTVVNSDAKTDPRTRELYDKAYAPLGLRAYILVPLLRDGTLVAHFAVQDTAPRAWQTREVALVEQLADRAWLLQEQLAAEEALRQHDAMRIAVLDSAMDGVLSIDGQGRVLDANPAAVRLFGRALTRGPRSLRDFFDSPVDAAGPSVAGLPIGRSAVLTAHRGTDRFEAEIAVTPIAGVEPARFAVQVRDVSERHQIERERSRLMRELGELSRTLEQRVEDRTRELAAAHESVLASEARLREDEARFRALFEASPISLWEEDFSGSAEYLDALAARVGGDVTAYLETHPEDVDAAASRQRFIATNQASVDLYGGESVDDVRTGLLELAKRPSVRALRTKLMCAVARRTQPVEIEGTSARLNGEPIHVTIRVTVVKGHEARWSRTVVSVYDMTAYKQVERALRDALSEKDALFREVHHRVKNNLQVISSLLALQSESLADPVARSALESSQARVHSIALVHERLYRSRRIDSVDFDAYIGGLLNALAVAHSADAERIELRVDPAGIEVGPDVAILCGLIVNELATNSLKHAFAAKRSGRITAGLTRDGAEFVLSVSDDGGGLPVDFSERRRLSLGSDLVDTFAAQLGATLERATSEAGTRLTLRFAERKE